MGKIKFSGRPAGSPNNKSTYVRNIGKTYRASEGMVKTLQALIANSNYKSASDVLHDAVQQLAYKKNLNKKELYWVNRIQ